MAPAQSGYGRETVRRDLPNRSRRVGDIVVAVFGVLLVAFGMVRGPAHIGTAIVGAALLTLAARSFRRMGIDFTDEELISYREFSQRRLRWSQVDSFRFRQFRGVGADLKAGGWVKLQAYPLLSDEGFKVVDTLNSLLRQYHASTRRR
jgi:hypothetical protein